MLRPLLITENFPPDRGGMAQSCDRIVRGLRALGIDVDVVHLSGRHEGVSVEQHERGLLLRCELSKDPGHALNLLWNALVQRKLAPSHVLAFGGYAPLLAAPSFAAWLGAPLITLLRGNDFDTGIFSPRRGFILRDALARSTAIAVVTRDHQHKVARLFPSKRVSYVPNGIDVGEWELFDFDRERAAHLRAQLPPERRVIGLFGHLKQKKGGLFFLDALASCAAAARIHLMVVGELEPAMQARLEELGTALSVTRVPFLDRLELLPWYAACDLVAIPSFYDGMPNVLLEAGALGIPLLAASAGGMADLLVDGVNALTFPPGDPHALRRALEVGVRSSDAALKALGGALRDKVLASFDQRAEAARYHTLLRETLAAERRGDQT